MDKRRFGRQVHGEVILDLCWDCHAIWFDHFESTQLVPGAVIELFRLIHEHRARAARPLADRMACPHCKAALVLTHDLQRTNRLTYHRCPQRHGRLTSFFQFLREKQFIRSLSPAEIEGLRATVRQVRCSGCGAIVNLERDSACGYCRSPISVLDAAAVEKTLADLTAAERKRTSADPVQIGAAFASLMASHRSAPRGSIWTRDLSTPQSSPAVIDLVVEGIGRLFR